MVSFKGFDTKYITMQCLVVEPDELKIGDFVKITNDGDVKLAGNGEAFFGIVVAVRDTYYTIQVSGYAEIAYAGTVPTMYSKFAVGSRGVATTDTTVTAPLCRVVWVDRNNNRAGILL